MQTTYDQKTVENEERLARIHDVYMRLLSERGRLSLFIQFYYSVSSLIVFSICISL